MPNQSSLNKGKPKRLLVGLLEFRPSFWRRASSKTWGQRSLPPKSYKTVQRRGFRFVVGEKMGNTRNPTMWLSHNRNPTVSSLAITLLDMCLTFNYPDVGLGDNLGEHLQKQGKPSNPLQPQHRKPGLVSPRMSSVSLSLTPQASICLKSSGYAENWEALD